ncbi:MAG: adenosine deaminase [Spirochaetaceae bacterium]|jgi:adenosine deaminase|nr:adenosine deaminase [Spirochaetaceae bacterium]
MSFVDKKFIERPKIDAHNHLNLGMRYASYVVWANFFIPDFPRPLNGLDEMHQIISEFTRPRCQTADDVEKLLSLAIEDAIADTVIVIEGSVDIGFINQCGGNIDTFLALVSGIRDKYAERIRFEPELGMGKTFDIAKLNAWVPECIGSGVFKSIDLYGPEVEEGIENFKGFFRLAGEKGLKKKAHVGEFSDSRSVVRFVEFFELDEVQHGIGAAADSSALRFLADNNIRCNVCPSSNVMLGAVPSLKEHPIRRMADAGVPVSIATDDLLFFNRSVGEQMADLVAAGVFSEDEVFSIASGCI